MTPKDKADWNGMTITHVVGAPFDPAIPRRHRVALESYIATRDGFPSGEEERK